MKNLKLIYCKIKNFDIKPSNILFLNSNQNNVAYIWSDNFIQSLNLETGVAEKLFEVHNVVAAEYLVLNDEISCATKNGEVVVYNVNRQTQEVVSFCEGGIEAMAWSPDQEVVAFVTKLRNVVVMSCTYDPILESSLDDTAFGDQEFIALGWGKKETQFHGSEGKQAAKIKQEVVTLENLDELDQIARITWRGDGRYFAVSFVGPYGRMFKVYDMEGRLQYTSEKMNNLGTSICWRHSGNWIAIPHELPNKFTVALFEKNGLRHREVVLPFKASEESIVSLSWSADSDALAVETATKNSSFVYLYTVGNYHWYLKQKLQFNSKISKIIWDVVGKLGKLLYILLENGRLINYRWEYTIHHSNGNLQENQSVVAVIDGKNLMLTDMRNNIVPPPMCSQTLENDTTISDCCFMKNPKTSKDFNQILTVDSQDKIKIFQMNFEKNQLEKYRLKGVALVSELQIQELMTPVSQQLCHWLWLAKDVLFVCQILEQSTIAFLCEINADEDQKYIKIQDKVEVPGHIGAVNSLNSESLVLHNTDGQMYLLKTQTGQLRELKLLWDLPEFCDCVEAVEHEGSMKIFSLKTKQNLYLNSTKIASDVTSFYLTEKYLVFTHLNSMKFMLLENNNITTERKIERGGKLVIIVPKHSRTILQMPRGNLEAIDPRPLSLSIVGEFLDQKKYKLAVDILRTQRINLNIIVDHNPKKFIENVDYFLEDISNPQWLNLFLSDLQNEDCTKTMFSGIYEQTKTSYPDFYSVENKINFLCDHMCDKMKAKDFKKYILPIITCFVKKGDIEKALDIIWSEKKKEKDSGGQNNLSEEAFKYLLYLVNVNDLYNVALGMYDFGLVLYVAKKSQKDPKEYVPFLNELNKLEVNYKKYKIDEHLKRYNHALVHLCKCCEDHIDECLQFIQKHKLYSQALMELEAKPDIYKKVAFAFADYLRAQGKLANASIMYERAGDLNQAIMSAKHVVDWQRCISLTHKLSKGNAVELQNITESLIPALQENGKFEECAFLVKTYCNDFPHSISILMKGHLYLKAIYQAQLVDTELIESTIKPHLETYKDILQCTIESDQEQFLKYKNRLMKVRDEMKKKADRDDQFDDNIDECDLLSDTTSMNSSRYTNSSKGTGKTFRSSKNRRKHERKLLSLKEGNPFEDIALIDAISNLIQKITNLQAHVKDICRALIEVSFDRDARQIQKSFANLLGIVKESLDDIWIPEMMTTQVLGQSVDYAQIQNDQHYSMIKPQQRFKPTLNLIDWEHEILK